MVLLFFIFISNYQFIFSLMHVFLKFEGGYKSITFFLSPNLHSLSTVHQMDLFQWKMTPIVLSDRFSLLTLLAKVVIYVTNELNLF